MVHWKKDEQPDFRSLCVRKKLEKNKDALPNTKQKSISEMQGVKIVGNAPSSSGRFAFKMKLKPGFAMEYKRRHDKIWSEMKEELKKAGISDYTIFLDVDTHDLYAFQKLAPDNTAADLPNNPVIKKWWDYMSDIMEYDSDHRPVAIPLREVFHLD